MWNICDGQTNANAPSLTWGLFVIARIAGRRLNLPHNFVQWCSSPRPESIAPLRSIWNSTQSCGTVSDCRPIDLAHYWSCRRLAKFRAPKWKCGAFSPFPGDTWTERLIYILWRLTWSCKIPPTNMRFTWKICWRKTMGWWPGDHKPASYFGKLPGTIWVPICIRSHLDRWTVSLYKSERSLSWRRSLRTMFWLSSLFAMIVWLSWLLETIRCRCGRMNESLWPELQSNISIFF